MNKNLKVILVEDEPGDAFLIEEHLSASTEFSFEIVVFATLKKALADLKINSYDVILLDLGLPDSKGLDSIEEINKMNLRTPILVITGLDNEQTGRLSINMGAQGYIVKSELDSRFLVNSILYSIERYQHLIKIKQNEKELEEKNILLLNANAAKDRLFSIIAHDLKSPFNSILGLIEMLHVNYENSTEKEIKSYISAILSNTQNTYKLLENLLLWSATQLGKIICSPEKISLEKAVKKNIESFNQLCKNKEIEIIVKLPPEIGILYDQDMFDTILRNLISNAIKFSNRNSKIVIGIQYAENEMAELYVKDFGIGIEKEDIPGLLSGNGILTTLGTESEKGTGLGMTICADFVEKHNGKIRIESEKGKGTTVYFTIPTIEMGVTEENVVYTGSDSETETKTILIVEDDRVIEIYLRIILTNSNFNVLSAFNGQDAINKVIENPDIDLILMDIHMPVLNGIDATKQIRKLRPKIPVIAQTAFYNNIISTQKSGVEFDDFLVKPLKRDDLISVIEKYIPVKI